ATDPAAASDALEHAVALLEDGHPIFARVLLDRVSAVPQLDAELRERIAHLRLLISLVLGDWDTARDTLAALPEESLLAADNPRRYGEYFFSLSGLTLILGHDRKLAKALLAHGNAAFADAGLLPRRLLKGY